jgi:hypothetical protein
MLGLAMNYAIFPGANDLGNIQACGIPTIQFINFTINGTAYAFHYPADSIFQYNSSTGLPDQQLINAVSGTNPNLSVNIRYSNLGIGINTSQELTRFITSFVDNLQVSEIHNPIFINITEYGAIGQFISGNFSGVVTGTYTVNTDYNVTCNFRVRRRT